MIGSKVAAVIHEIKNRRVTLFYSCHLVGLVFLFHLYIVQARPNKTMSSKDRKSDGLTYGNKQQASKMNASVAKLTNVCWLVTLMLGLAVICLHLGRRVSLRTSDELIHAEHVISEAAHRLAIRAECNATGPAFESAADAMTAVGFSGSITASQLITITSETLSSAPPTTTTTTTESPVDTVSVSTQTSMTTLDGVSNTDQRLTITATTTGTTTITLLPVPEYTEASYGSCQATVTETVWVTVYPPSDATVTASLSTFTTVNTVVSYTAGLPDVTISGNPSTYTAVQTDTSFTSGPPDATVSGDASTVTDIRTDVSVTSGLPDATVSGGAATVTDMQTSWTWPLTTTYSTPFTTITISDLWGPSSSNSVSETEDVRLSTFVTIISSQIVVTLSDSSYVSSEQKGDATSLSASPTSTYTLLLTTTGGPPAVETTTVDVFPPAYAGSTYNTTAGGNPPSSTSSVMTPVVVSGGNKKPEPKAWGGSNGSSNLACTVMLIAVIMFMS
ncbi:uncharacterized protein UV8b_03782 [Ustilaginoidea virens]|uniref:Uncharacterized protein n=2 Tax=Ustilaginoidea virens TaxID=1159556 RepID=A0A8E5HQ54_USTVR|nr:uncharacterized protein UV8b_03782 [Ustilaginoidea virens]QUC19541.1 hypothetical protein UV8b_03782 [Ustilaginoidea virens]